MLQDKHYIQDEIKPENAEQIQGLADTDYTVEFPIDLNLDSMIHISLPEIRWENFDSIPSSMKISNIGKSVILTTHWADKKRPCISGGPLLGNYAFSQLHFLWGRKDFRGGKHTYNRKTFPLEIHALFYKCEYRNRAEALRHKDGAIVLVFASKVNNLGDPAMDRVCSSLSALSSGDSSNSHQLEPPIRIGDLVHEFAADYFLYWGSISTSSCNHLLLWLVCRKPFLISQSQVHHFRRLMTAKQNHIMNNSQSTARIHPNFKRVFHINPSRYFADVLYESHTPQNPLPRKEYNKINRNCVSDSLRPSTTAGIRGVRSELQSSIFRPRTAAKVDTSRKENSRSGSDRASMRGRPRKSVNDNGKNPEVKNRRDKSGVFRSKSVTSRKSNNCENIPSFGICGKEENRRGIGSRGKGDVQRDTDKTVTGRKSNKSENNIPSFGICVNDDRNMGRENRRRVESREGEECVQGDTDKKEGEKNNKYREGHLSELGFEDMREFGGNVFGLNESRLTQNNVNELEFESEMNKIGDPSQILAKTCFKKMDDHESGLKSVEDEPVEQIFMNKIGGLKEFRRELETIYSEGSNHSVVNNFIQNSIQNDSSYPSTYYGNVRCDNESNYIKDRVVVQNDSSYPTRFYGNVCCDDESNHIQVEKNCPSEYSGNVVCDEFADEFSQKIEKTRKPRSCFTNTTSSVNQAVSIKDSLEVIRQSFVKIEAVMNDDDYDKKEERLGESMNDNNNVDCKNQKSKLQAKQSSVKTSAPSKKDKMRSFFGIKSRENKSRGNSARAGNSSPPRWRY